MTWANALLLEVSEGKRAPYMWDEFHMRMIARFESITKNEEVHKELRELCQIARVVGYTTKFQELHSRLLGIVDQEEFSMYLARLNSHLCE